MPSARRVCAWCRKDMGAAVGDGYDPRFPITHGMCGLCFERFLPAEPKPMREFLESLEAPVILLQAELRVIAANEKARALLGKELSAVEGRLPGEAIECVHSRTPEGCGMTVHCQACTIRRCLVETLATGKSCLNVAAYPDVQLGSAVKTLSLGVSTEKAGDCVMVKVESLPARP